MSCRSYRNCTTNLDFVKSMETVSNHFFSFKHNYSHISCSNGHFQLKNNIKFIEKDQIAHLRATGDIGIFNPFDNYTRTIKYKEGMTIISFNILDKYVASGGTEGELHLDTFNGKSLLELNVTQNATHDMTNSCHLFYDSGFLRVMACSNDNTVKIINPEDPHNKEVFTFESCVNHATLNNQNMLAVARDAIEVIVVDRSTATTIMELEGHYDFLFGVAWNPTKEWELASCNQDHSVRIWDIRMGQCVNLLCGKLGAVYKVDYSRDGKYLAFSENVDFVHVYDTRSYDMGQEIDLFGELAGFDFNKEGNAIYIGVTDATYKSLVEFRSGELGHV